MLPRLARLLAWLLLAPPCVACGSPDSRSGSGEDKALPSAGTLGGASFARVLRPIETTCPSSEAETPQAGTPLWLQSYDAPEITSVASDGQGNLFLTRAGVGTLKLACNGERVWSKPFGTRVAVDADDNVYLGQIDRAGSAALTKLSREGQVIYSSELGAHQNGALESLTVDAAGNVALSGAGLGTVLLDGSGRVSWRKEFFGQLAFDSRGHLWLLGSLVGNLQLGGTRLTSRGGSDVLLLELAADGTPLLARTYGDSAALQRGEAIALDGADNVLIAGTFDGNVDFGAGALSLEPAACSTDAWCQTAGFVAKLDARGDAIWSKGLGPMRALPSMAADSAGQVLVSGVLPGGVRPFRQPLLLALDPSGEPQWQRAEWPDTGVGAGSSVALDGRGHVLWALSARPSLQLEEQSYLAKLAL